jgi:hypothetical protein
MLWDLAVGMAEETSLQPPPGTFEGKDEDVCFIKGLEGPSFPSERLDSVAFSCGSLSSHLLDSLV